MSRIFNEDVISIQDARSLFPIQPHPSTISKWSSIGARGVFLETPLLGGKRVTSREACERFLEALNIASSN
jgi:hypothetical protein